MATVTTNALVKGFRGKFGKLVFRTIGNKTYVSPEPRKPDKKKETEAQRNTRVTFKKASEWARMILKDPVQKTYYLKRAEALKLPNAYTAALTDYMRKPKVTKVQLRDTVTYTVLKPGFAIKEVHVSDEISNAPPNIVKSRYKEQWLVKHIPDVGSESIVTLTIIDSAGKSTVFKVT